jgi:hypothetical protein
MATLLGVAGLDGTMSQYHEPRRTTNTTNFTPASIAGLQLWLDGSDEATKIVTGSGISTWVDKSGNARNATQATDANRPANVSGGAPAAGVSGVTGTKFLALASGLALGTSATIVVVCTAQSSAAGYVLSDGVGNNSSILSHHAATGDFEWFNTPDRPKFVNDPVIGNRYRLVLMQANGGSLIGRVDGSAAFSVTATVNLTQLLVLGAAATSGISSYRGIFHEVIVYSGILTVTDLSNLEGYLARWAA